MARSQNSFIKREREKKKARKKQEKQEKKELRKQSDSNNGPEIDWSSAPENKTLTNDEKLQRAQNQRRSKAIIDE